MMRTIVALVLLCPLVSGLAHADDSTFEKKVAANPHGIVEVSSFAGTIDISAWDNAEVDVRADMGGGVDRIDVKADPGRVTIKVVVSNHMFRSDSTTLHVRVPRQSELDVSAVSADISTADVEGRSQLKTVSGIIKADVFDSSAEIKSVSGDVSLRGRGKGSGMGIRVSTISGNIRIDRASGDLDATSVSGDLTVRLDPTRNIRVRTTSGDVGLEARFAKGGYLDAETVSGDMTLHAISESGMDYEVNTFSGEIRNCMAVPPERASKYGPGQRLVGTVGGTGADALRVRVKSMSGEVDLCDKG